MATEMKLTNTIHTAVLVLSNDAYTTIFSNETTEARIGKILVSNLESSDVSLRLYSQVLEVKTLIQTFSIPADAGTDGTTPPFEIIKECELSSQDAAGNFFLNTMANEQLLLKLVDAESCDLHITVKAELYD